jgi:hypothetical protein
MNDSDSDSDSDNDNDHHQLQGEDGDDDDIIVDKLIPILQRKGEFSMRTRNKINELARQFLEILGDDIHDMLCDNDTESENYRGLNDDYDTEVEVETALRFFPELLSRTTKDKSYVDNYGDVVDGTHCICLYPFQFLAFTVNEGSF